MPPSDSLCGEVEMLEDISIRALIADDEPLARRGIRQLLASRRDVEVVGEARNGRETVNAVRRLRPDLLFLDVQMPELDGFGVLSALGPAQCPAVIFVTAYDDFAVRAFEAHALDYLVKPVEEARFGQALDRTRERMRSVAAMELSQRLSSLLSVEHQKRLTFRTRQDSTPYYRLAGEARSISFSRCHRRGRDSFRRLVIRGDVRITVQASGPDAGSFLRPFRVEQVSVPSAVIDRFENGFCSLNGSFIPFARTKAEREAGGDPRPSIEERYASHQAYIEAVTKAAGQAVKDRLMLQEDADRFIESARHKNPLRIQDGARLN